MSFSNFTDEAFAAYLAGFTDGEGYIGIESTTRKNVSVVRIVIANCVPEVLYGIKERLGFGAIRSQKLRAHWRERFTLTVSNMKDCESYLNIVFPYLHIKKDVATKAFNLIEQARQKYLSLQSRNEEIRKSAAAGEQRKSIAERFKVSPQTISRICEGHKWQSEWSKYGSHRKRDDRGLFVPVIHN